MSSKRTGESGSHPDGDAHQPVQRRMVNGRYNKWVRHPWSSATVPFAESNPAQHDDLVVEAFARGLAVIRSFANRQHPLTIAEVSRRADVSRSAARRLLHTLVTLGYASVNEHGFALLPKTLTLASAFLSSDVLVELAQPIVHKLAAAIGGTFCSLTVLQSQESQIICLAYLRQPSERHLADPNIGQSTPLYCCSSGLLFLSDFSEEQLNNYFSHIRLQQFTQRTMTDPAQLRQRFKSIQENGYAMVDREMSEELRGISVPVRDRQGRMVAALVSVASPQETTLAELKARLPILNAAAQELSRQL